MFSFTPKYSVMLSTTSCMVRRHHTTSHWMWVGQSGVRLQSYRRCSTRFSQVSFFVWSLNWWPSPVRPSYITSVCSWTFAATTSWTSLTTRQLKVQLRGSIKSSSVLSYCTGQSEMVHQPGLSSCELHFVCGKRFTDTLFRLAYSALQTPLHLSTGSSSTAFSVIKIKNRKGVADVFFTQAL